MAAIYYQILQAVQSQLQNVANIPTVVLRKKLKLFNPKVDTNAIVIIAPGRGGEQITDEATDYQVVWSYPVVVALILPGDDIQTLNLAAHMQLRQDMRNQLYQLNLPNVSPPQFDIQIDTDEVQELQAELGTSYDVTGWQVHYECNELRLS